VHYTQPSSTIPSSQYFNYDGPCLDRDRYTPLSSTTEHAEISQNSACDNPSESQYREFDGTSLPRSIEDEEDSSPEKILIDSEESPREVNNRRKGRKRKYTTKVPPDTNKDAKNGIEKERRRAQTLQIIEMEEILRDEGGTSTLTRLSKANRNRSGLLCSKTGIARMFIDRYRSQIAQCDSLREENAKHKESLDRQRELITTMRNWLECRRGECDEDGQRKVDELLEYLHAYEE
jgi:hypothetical protein